MKTLPNLIVIIAGAGVGLLVGLGLRGKSAPKAEAAPSQSLMVGTSTVQRSESLLSTKSRARVRADDSPLATKLERDLSMSSGVTRWLYWLEALEAATPGDCPRLAQLAQGNGPLLRLVAARWIDMDPQHMFTTLVSKQGTGFPVYELKRLLFEEWPKRDVDAVLAALTTSQGVKVPKSWCEEFAVSLVENDVERGLRLMSEWDVDDGNGPRLTGVKKWAAANPRHAAEFTLANPAGYASRLIMEVVGKEWAKTDPAGAMEFAKGQGGELSPLLGKAVLKEWAGRNLNEAADWLAKTDSASRNRLSPAFVEAWGKFDATSALKWCEANLMGAAFANAAAGLVKGAAEVDLSGAADLVASMAPSKARAEAAVVLMRSRMPYHSPPREPVAPEAIAWLARLDSDSINRVMEQVRGRWAEADPDSLSAFLQSLDPEKVSEKTYFALAREKTRRNPMEALEWASHVPEKHRVSTETQVFNDWQRSQPEFARQWLKELPQSDPRREPFFQNVVAMMVYDSRSVEQLTAMTPAEQTAARPIIEKMPIPEERRSALLKELTPR